MIIPVRCFSCGHVIGHLWERYSKAVNKFDVENVDFKDKAEEAEKAVKNEDKAKIAELTLSALDVNRYCCRRMFVSHVELIDAVAPFSVTRTQE